MSYTPPPMSQRLTTAHPRTIPGHSNGIMSAKDEQIARSVALNNACVMVEAVAQVIKTLKLNSEWSADYAYTHLKMIKEKEYQGNLKAMGIKPTAEDLF